MRTHFEIRVRALAWDNKWIYILARYVSRNRKGEEVLHCVSVSRMTFKMQGSRLTIPPSRVLSAGGCGSTAQNWERTLALRKQGRSRDWLRYGALKEAAKKGITLTEVVEPEPGWDEEHLEEYEERRARTLQFVSSLGDLEAWRAL